MTSRTDIFYFKKYVGQAGVVGVRLPRHERDRLTSKSLFHVTWRRQGENREVKWIRLGKRSWQGRRFGEEADEAHEALWMNVYEMFYAVALQTLSEFYLDHWTAGDVQIWQPHGGLNVALPLHQGLLTDEGRRNMGTQYLHNSSDPEQVNYVKNICTRGGLNAWESQDNDWQVSETRHAYDLRGEVLFKKSWLKSIKRRMLPHEVAPIVKCQKCGFERVDYNPYYTLSDDEYIDRRTATCYGSCPPTSAKIATGQRRGMTVHILVDTSIKSITEYEYHKKYFGRGRAMGGRTWAAEKRQLRMIEEFERELDVAASSYY